MSWQSETVMELRYTIGDFTQPYIYQDATLQQLLCVAGVQIQRDITFLQPYTIDIVNSLITPDPTDPNLPDPDFTTIACIKSACILAKGKATSDGFAAGIYLRDKASEFDTRQKTASIISIIGTLCQAYKDIKLQYVCGNQNGMVILTPFRVGFYGSDGFFTPCGRGGCNPFGGYY